MNILLYFEISEFNVVIEFAFWIGADDDTSMEFETSNRFNVQRAKKHFVKIRLPDVN